MTPLRNKSKLISLFESSYVRVTIVLVLALVGYFALVTYFVNSYTGQMYEFRKQELRRLVEIGLNTIQPIREQQRRGELSDEQARARAIDLVRHMMYTYGPGNNYLFMSSYTGQMLVQPFEPDKEGSDQWDLKDVNGKYIIRSLVAAATSPAGKGYVEYDYPPPGSKDPQVKLSYVVGIPEWSAYIGTGMYMEDIESENALYVRNSLLLTGCLAVVILGIIFVALRPVMSSHHTLLELFEQVRRDPNSTPDVPARQWRTGSEGWKLLSGFGAMLEQIQESREIIRQSQQALEVRIAERTHELATLNAIAEVVSGSLDLNQVLNAAVSKAREAMRMEVGTAYSIQEGEGPDEDKDLLLAARQGLSPEFSRRVGSRRVSGTAIQVAARAQKPIVWLVSNYPDPQLKQALEMEGVRQVINVPLFAKGKFVGALNLGTRQEREIQPEELSLLAAIGHQVALAVENARLYDQAEQSAAMAERTRLARELHDSVTQSLYSMVLYAEASAVLLGNGEHIRAAEHLRELRDTAQEALREMRLLIFELRPLALEKNGLGGALQSRLDSVETRGGIKAELQVQGEELLPLVIEKEVYHLAREALNNVIKHAHAQKVRVQLQVTGNVACLQIMDDGVGFDVTKTAGGLGLAGMRERVQKLGGMLRVESTPGHGTLVTAEVPCITPDG